MNRRGFLAGIIAAAAAPAIIRTPGLIMPIKPALLEIGAEINTWGPTLLTHPELTRHALAILHQKLRFMTNIYAESAMIIHGVPREAFFTKGIN